MLARQKTSQLGRGDDHVLIRPVTLRRPNLLLQHCQHLRPEIRGRFKRLGQKY